MKSIGSSRGRRIGTNATLLAITILSDPHTSSIGERCASHMYLQGLRRDHGAPHPDAGVRETAVLSNIGGGSDGRMFGKTGTLRE